MKTAIIFRYLMMNLFGKVATLGPMANLSGTVFGPEGTPLRGGKVYLGSGDDVVLSADYGEDGHYRFESIPAGRYDYLAVSAPLDGTYFPCLFVRKDVILEAGSSQLLDIAYEPPALPTPAAATVEAPPEMVGADGQKRSHFTDFTIYNPFDWTWERQRVMYRVEFAQGASSDSLCLYDTATHTIIPHQLTDEVPLPSPSGRGDGGEVLSSAKIHFFAQVAPKTRQIYRLYYDTHRGFSTTLGIRNSEFGIRNFAPFPPFPFRRNPEDPIGIPSGLAPLPFSLAYQVEGESVTISTGKIQARFPFLEKTWDVPIEASEVPPPLEAVKGLDGVWRGTGRLTSPLNVQNLQARIIHTGAVFIEYSVRYHFEENALYEARFLFGADENYFTVSETCDGIEGGAFEWSFANFQPDIGLGVAGGIQEENLNYDADKALYQLPNYILTWIPKQGFGYCLARSEPSSKDCIGIVSVHRGAWRDERWARETWTPVRADVEANWNIGRYCGSHYSAISIHQTQVLDGTEARWTGQSHVHYQANYSGDLFYRFPLHAGTRQWACVVYDKALNEQDNGQFIRQFHVTVGSMTLNDYKDFVTEWTPQRFNRPLLNYSLNDLPRMRQNLALSFFQALWEDEKDSLFRHVWGYEDSLFRGFLTGDPRPFWRGRTFRQTVLHWATQTFKGLDLGHDPYNLVSIRMMSNLCEAYDLLEASGVFSTEELREIRAALSVLGYRIMDPDWITWHYNAGQQDFDAARYAGVAALGFVLPDHPKSNAWIRHAIDRVLFSNFIWGVPDSGKWAENPACYYQQTLASEVYVAHQAFVAGHEEILRSKDFQEFLRWGLLLLTPPHPNDAKILAEGSFPPLPAPSVARQAGLGGQEGGFPTGKEPSVVKTRHIPGIGNHGGPAGVEIKYDLALMAGDLRSIAPDLAQELMGSFWESGGKTLMESHRPPLTRAQMIPGRLLIAALTEDDLQRHRPPTLVSRPLAGYGAVLRHSVPQQRDESYVLFKCGPGGARFDADENSIVYYGKGAPLIIDGGDVLGSTSHSMPTRLSGEMFRRGALTRFRSLLDAHLAVGATPKDRPELARHLLLVKDDYLVIYDDVQIHEPTQWHLLLLANDAVVRTCPEERGNDSYPCFSFRGRFDVDVDVFLPNGWTRTQRITTDYMTEEGRQDSARIPVQHLAIDVPTGEDTLALLFPRKVTTPQPHLRSLGNAFEITFRERRRSSAVNSAFPAIEAFYSKDVLFIHGKPIRYRDGERHFEGRIGLIRTAQDMTELYLLDGCLLEASNLKLMSTGPSVAVRRIASEQLVGETSGEAGTVFLQSPDLMGGLQLYLDSVLTTPKFVDGCLFFTLNAGFHRFECVLSH